MIRRIAEKLPLALFIVIVSALLMTITAPAAASEPLRVRPRTATVYIDGIAKSFDAYLINGNNYFKLRDLAYALSGTDAQFNVVWHRISERVEVRPNSPYSAVGGEMTSIGSTEQLATSVGRLQFYRMQSSSLTPYFQARAYLISGNNFVMLRDVASAIDFGVEWDGINNAIHVDTSMGYEDEPVGAPSGQPWQFSPKDAENMDSVHLFALMGGQWEDTEIYWTEEMISSLIRDLELRGYTRIVRTDVPAKEPADMRNPHVEDRRIQDDADMIVPKLEFWFPDGAWQFILYFNLNIEGSPDGEPLLWSLCWQYFHRDDGSVYDSAETGVAYNSTRFAWGNLDRAYSSFMWTRYAPR